MSDKPYKIGGIEREPILCSQGGAPYNKAHLDAKDAEIKRLHDLHLDRTKLTTKMIAERDEERDALEQAQQLQRVTADTVSQQDELLNMHSERIERLTAESSVLLTAIAEIAGQKLCKEMALPDDGDYRYAYEEIIRVARLASDAVRATPEIEAEIQAHLDGEGVRICDFRGNTCPSKATSETQLRGSSKWHACCDYHAGFAMREGAKFRDLAPDENSQETQCGS